MSVCARTRPLGSPPQPEVRTLLHLASLHAAGHPNRGAVHSHSAAVPLLDADVAVVSPGVGCPATDATVACVQSLPTSGERRSLPAGHRSTPGPALDPRTAAIARLRSANLRMTRHRLAILAASLKGKPASSSIQQIHAAAGSERCNLVTVYRCMAAFEKAGLVSRVFSRNDIAYFQLTLDRPRRCHVFCNQTGRVREISSASTAIIEHAIQSVQRELRYRGYSEVGHIVEFFGQAPTLPAGDAPSTSRAADRLSSPTRPQWPILPGADQLPANLGPAGGGPTASFAVATANC